MKRKTDWSDTAARAMQPNVRLVANDGSPADSVFVEWMSKKLRAAEKRGYMRAVKLLRLNEHMLSGWKDAADWLEEEGRK